MKAGYIFVMSQVWAAAWLLRIEASPALFFFLYFLYFIVAGWVKAQEEKS